MTELLVTGIAQTSDPAALEAVLERCNCHKERLSIITKADASGAHQRGHGGSSLSSSSTIMTGAGGTAVPGVGGSNASLSSFVGHGGGADYLGGLPLIPADQAQNYNTAIAEGRSLVTYKATAEEAPAVEAAFREAGLRKVRTFKSNVASVSP